MKRLDEDEKIEVVEVQDDTSKNLKSTQHRVPEIEIRASQFCSEKRASYETPEISGITDKVSVSSRKILREQKSDAPSKF